MVNCTVLNLQVGVVSTERMPLSSNWLYDAVSAKVSQYFYRIDNCFCNYFILLCDELTSPVKFKKLVSSFETRKNDYSKCMWNRDWKLGMCQTEQETDKIGKKIQYGNKPTFI